MSSLKIHFTIINKIVNGHSFAATLTFEMNILHTSKGKVNQIKDNKQIK